jgi:hypothetical protein
MLVLVAAAIVSMVVQETTNLLLVGDFEDGIDRILINNLDLSADNISITEGIIAVNGQNIAQLLGIDSALLTIDDSNPNSVSID